MGSMDLPLVGFVSELPGVAFSPSIFLSFSLLRPILEDPQSELFENLSVDLLGNSSWREVEIFFSWNLGFSAPHFHGGFEVVEGFKQVAADGVARQVLVGSGSSGGASEEDLRVPLGVEEQRGFVSPSRVSGKGKVANVGSSQGDKEVGSGSVKRSRRSWVKTK